MKNTYIITSALSAIIVLLTATSCSNDDSIISPPVPQPIAGEWEWDMYYYNDNSAMAESVMALNNYSSELFIRLIREADNQNFVFSPYLATKDLILSGDTTRNTAADKLLSSKFMETLFERLSTVFANGRDIFPYIDNFKASELSTSVWSNGSQTNRWQISESNKYKADILTTDFSTMEGQWQFTHWINKKTPDLNRMDSYPLSNANNMIMSVFSSQSDWNNASVANIYSSTFHSINGHKNIVDMLKYGGPCVKLQNSYRGFSVLALMGKFMIIVYLPESESLDNHIADFKPLEYFPKNECESVTVGIPLLSIENSLDLTKSVYASNSSENERIAQKCSLDFNDMNYMLGVQSILYDGSESVINKTYTTVASKNSEKINADIVVNKPFIFEIREPATGAILFMGKVENL